MSKVFKHSFISEGKFFTAGIPIEDKFVRPFMLRYLAKEEIQPSSSKREINALRQYNQRYYVNAEGEMTVPARRQLAELEAQNAFQDHIDEIANEPPDETTEAILDDIREEHQADVQRQIAQAKVTAERADEMNDAVRQEQDEKVEAGEFYIEEKEPPRAVTEMDASFKPPPAKVIGTTPKPKWQYVKRGSVFRRVKDRAVKLKIGEPVYVRDGSNGFEKIGVVQQKEKIENE